MSLGLLFTALGAVIFLFVITDRVVEVPGGSLVEKVTQTVSKVIRTNVDIEAQKPLQNPPAIIKAIYSTNWSAGSEKKILYFLDLLNTTELNAIVIDIKDYTGVVAWPSRVPRINALIKRFHDADVYVIGRIAVFQDGELVKARPDLALHSSSTNAVWGDNKGVHWLDTASIDVWDYNAKLAKDALARGFDEINFDYIRFPSDGNIADIRYPFYDRVTLKTTVLRKFFTYMRKELPDAKLSADFFGEATYTDESGIGQRMKDAFAEFDFIAPMIYPSHYANGFNGHPNPADAPYDVVHYSMEQAVQKLRTYNLGLRTQNNSSSLVLSSESLVSFRPWLQDFNLGATYTADMVRAQIDAVEDLAGWTPLEAGRPEAAVALPSAGRFLTGWMLWNPSNVYTKSALLTDF